MDFSKILSALPLRLTLFSVPTDEAEQSFAGQYSEYAEAQPLNTSINRDRDILTEVMTMDYIKYHSKQVVDKGMRL